MVIYLDESGDLGFDFAKQGTTNKFVIALLVCDDTSVTGGFRKAVRRTLKNKVSKAAALGDRALELKGAASHLSVKSYFYRNVPETGWRLFVVALNKTRVYDPLRSPHGKKKLYNFLARFLLEKVDFRDAGPAVTLVVDKSKNKEEIRDFNSYLANQLEALLPLNVPLYVSHERSHENAGLQAVDLFCWGVFRKYERQDEAWYSYFRDRISFETEYLP